MSYSSWVSNGTNVAYEPKEKNTGEVITSFATTSPGGVPNSSYAPSTYVLAASGAWIAPTVSSNNSEISRPSVYTELTGLPVPYFSATDTNLVYDADANHITTFGEFTLEGLNVLNDASFTYTSFAAKSQTWTASKLNISRNYPRTRWNTGTEARFYLSTDSGSTWTLILTDDYDSDPIAVTIFSHTLATVNPSSLSAYQVKVEIDSTAGTGLGSVGVLNLQLYDIWIEGIYAVSGGSGTVTSITTTGANGVTISGGSTQTITTSGTFALALGAITPTSIATGTGSFSGDVEFAASIKSPTNSPVTIAPDGTGDVHLNTDSVRIGDNNADATIATRGTGDLIITTHEGSANEGIVRLYDGVNGNITLTPNGSGQVKVGTDQVVTLIASQTLTNKSISGSTNTLSNIGNASLTNSTISGVALGSNLNALTISSPLTGTSYNGSSAVSIGIPVATTSVNGYLSSTDWTTFNNKGSGTVTSVTGGTYLTGGTITTTGTLAVDATSANTASKVVARDASGNFSAGTITANGLDITGSASPLIRIIENTTTGNPKLQLLDYTNITTPTEGTELWYESSTGHSYLSSIYSAGSLIFRTANTERVRIDSSGNVGIGTASPAFKLHTYIASGTAMFKFESGANTGIYGHWVRPNQSYIQALNLDNNGDKDFSLYDATNSQVADRYYPSSAGYRAFFTNGSERVRIDSSGNVGIGISTVLANYGGYKTLELNGTTGGLLSLDSNGTNNLQMYTNGSTVNIVTIGALPLTFGTNSTERVRITSAGLLGIGTASPSQKLTLGGQTGSSATPLALQFSDDWSDGYVASKSKIYLYNNGGSGVWGFAVGPDNDIQYHSGGATNTNGQHKWYSGNVEFMRLNASGNLGIGTAAPYNKVEIEGASARLGLNNGGGASRKALLIEPLGYGGNTYARLESYDYGTSTGGILAINVTGGNVGIGTASPTNKLQVNGVMVGNNAAGSYTKGFGGILTTTSTSTPTGGSSGDFALIY